MMRRVMGTSNIAVAAGNDSGEDDDDDDRDDAAAWLESGAEAADLGSTARTGLDGLIGEKALLTLGVDMVVLYFFRFALVGSTYPLPTAGAAQRRIGPDCPKQQSTAPTGPLGRNG